MPTILTWLEPSFQPSELSYELKRWTVDTLDTDSEHNTVIIAVGWMLTAIAILCTLLRFYSRLRITHNLGSDDWFMVAAVVRYHLWQHQYCSLAITTERSEILTKIQYAGIANSFPSSGHGSAPIPVEQYKPSRPVHYRLSEVRIVGSNTGRSYSMSFENILRHSSCQNIRVNETLVQVVPHRPHEYYSRPWNCHGYYDPPSNGPF